MTTRLRINLNSNALFNAIQLVSNTVQLTANAFLVGARFNDYFRDRRREQLVNRLQTTAEIAAAAATMSKLITETLEKRTYARD
mgnify:CR=1 FL=1